MPHHRACLITVVTLCLVCVSGARGSKVLKIWSGDTNPPFRNNHQSDRSYGDALVTVHQTPDPGEDETVGDHGEDEGGPNPSDGGDPSPNPSDGGDPGPNPGEGDYLSVDHNQYYMYQSSGDASVPVSVPSLHGECGYTNDTICYTGPPPPLYLVDFPPPPPIPPFMEALLQGFMEDNLASPQTLDAGCGLCRWSVLGHNHTRELPTVAQDSWSLSPLLAGVSIGSALTGALLTIVCIHCRRSQSNKSLLPTPSPCPGICPFPPRAKAPPSDSPAQQADISTTSRTGWAMQLWRQKKKHSVSPPPNESENSYSEEPSYSPTQLQSSVYDELNPELLDATYSEIGEQCPPTECVPRHSDMSQHHFAGGCLSQPYGVYANSDRTESSSDPSSAYYSDISNDLEAIRKKRRKKKGNCEAMEQGTYVNHHPNNAGVANINNNHHLCNNVGHHQLQCMTRTLDRSPEGCGHPSLLHTLPTVLRTSPRHLPGQFIPGHAAPLHFHSTGQIPHDQQPGNLGMNRQNRNYPHTVLDTAHIAATHCL